MQNNIKIMFSMQLRAYTIIESKYHANVQHHTLDRDTIKQAFLGQYK